MPNTRQFDRALVWFRRDLRLADHTALSQALARSRQVWCAFVFDTEILDALPSRSDRRVEFIWHALAELDAALRARGGGLIVRHARARDEIPRLAAELRAEAVFANRDYELAAVSRDLLVARRDHDRRRHARARDEIPRLAAELRAEAVFANRDYEPAAVSRDEEVARRLSEAGARLETFKDQVIFERDEIMTGGGTPYSVFTPYKNAWLKRLAEHPFKASGLGNARALAPSPQVASGAAAAVPQGSPAAGAMPAAIAALESLGFRRTNLLELPLPTGMSGAEKLFRAFLRRIDNYDRARDFPSVRAPSYLSVHLRFGTVSIRHLVAHALALSSPGARVWLSELIWREFYFQILHHHPRVVNRAFKPEFEQVHFDNDPARFAAWCEGRTGYPLVDAAMRQLNATGYMHNRLRMLAACFLVKDLHVDWRWGERHFAAHLNDFDLAANNGGWQWAASTGCDAQPYFRIFNPVTQSQKFDAEGTFIRRYVPELANIPLQHLHAPWHMGPLEQQTASCVLGRDYPAPIVDHDASRKLSLERYAAARAHGPQ